MSMSSRIVAPRLLLRVLPQAQRETWDDFVNAHPHGHLLQSWAWGELKAGANWSPLRLALWDDESKRIVAGAQVLRRIVPHVVPRFGYLGYVPRGPVIDWADQGLCDEFFRLLHAYLRRDGAIALRVEPNVPGDETIVGYLERQGMRQVSAVQPKRTIQLGIEVDEAALLAQMKEKWRYNVRLAARKGVTVRVAETIEDVQAWYALLQTTGERDEFGIHTLAYYAQVWRLFSVNDSVRLLLAECEGQLLAGIFVSVFAGEGIYLYGASSNEQRNLMPNYLLQWEAIRWAKSRGATTYDFWGIPETDAQDEAMAGVYRFKRGWGGHIVQFPGVYQYTYRPLVMRVVEKFLSS